MTTPHPCTCGAQATFEQSLSDDGLLTTIVGCTECANKRIVRYPNFLHWAMKKELRTEIEEWNLCLRDKIKFKEGGVFCR